MFTRNGLKKIVLQYVKDMGVATSRQISERLYGKAWRFDHKKICMTLLKCKRQRLLGRALVKRGRVREYRYRLTERGRERLAYYRRKESEAISAIDFEEVIREARHQAMPIDGSAHVLFNCAENICNITEQKNVYSMGKQCANMSAHFIVKKHDIISAFAAKKALSLIAPEASLAIENALTISSTHDPFDVTELASITSRVARLGNFRESLSSSDLIWLLMIKRIRELHAGQYFLYSMYEEERKMKEGYKSLYESDKALHKTQGYAMGTAAYMHAWNADLELWLKLGMILGERRAYLHMQHKLLTYLTKAYSSRKRKEQTWEAILTRRSLNRRWWDFLPLSYGSPRLPVRGPAGS